MIAETNKKLSPIATELFMRDRKKTQHFTCFYITIVFHSAERYKTKHNTLFYHENN